VSIRLYDSLTQEEVDFTPLVPGRVSMYVCGPTVQSEPHIGHFGVRWSMTCGAGGLATADIR